MSRVNRAHMTRVRLLLEKAEAQLADPRRTSVGDLWRRDVMAIRYVFDRLLVELARPYQTQRRTR